MMLVLLFVATGFSLFLVDKINKQVMINQAALEKMMHDYAN